MICEMKIERMKLKGQAKLPLYYTEQPVLSTRHMLSRFMPYFANCSLTAKMLKVSNFNKLPYHGLQLGGDGAIATVPAEDKCSIIFQHWV